ncbi:putative sensor histidine kinase TcrY [Mycobacterium talmoniae]|uniref:histidine kinase n=2 Tax=Mycobacterium talmoniae TaxID=1858794 RepID=A0A2S8BPN3_9MYCO|nr:ATP-binding protein [Mycobacterium eburneum]PQM48632.1 putative sensor histidine kinase TcrY [Mycobacterium talmoniae]TDH50046.1 HAMP domain-containing protein [Mycobacterium eburneum]
MTPSRTTRWWWPRSVRRQLVLGVSAVVTVVLVAVGLVSVLSLRTYVTAMNDADVSESLNALNHSYTRYRSSQAAPGHPAKPSIEQALLGFTEQEPGNVIAVLHDGQVIGTAVFFSEDEPRPAPEDVVAAIAAETWHNGPARNINLASLGPYRVDSRGVDGGDRLVVGVSLSLANRTITNRIITATAFLVGALVVTAVLTVWVVGYALRPLRRVAATAATVASMPLIGGDERITARVRQDDIDPDNEVGIVAHTLNRLLDNVDGALAYRAEADKRMRQFITDASHELRTPLAAIQGYAELTRQDSSDLPPTTEYALARIESEAQRMASLVEELLLLSRLGEGQDLHLEEVDLVDLVIHAVNDAAASAPTHQWVKDLPDEAVWVRGDRARLHQLISNLLKNAWVHTPPGVTVTTGITAHRGDVGGPSAELTVIDTGPDIDAQLLPHLFERFVRADKARSGELGSTGLGLAIVASIVKAHHGTVTAESADGRTVFRVRLPLIDPPGN